MNLVYLNFNNKKKMLLGIIFCISLKTTYELYTNLKKKTLKAHEKLLKYDKLQCYETYSLTDDEISQLRKNFLLQISIN